MPTIICACFPCIQKNPWNPFKAPLERDAARFSLALAFKPKKHVVEVATPASNVPNQIQESESDPL